MKILTALLFILISVTPTTNAALYPPDHSFKAFLQRFASDEQFRMNRIIFPLTARMGNKALVKVRVERWSRKEIKDKLTPLLSKQELTQKGLSQLVRKRLSNRIEVFQFQPESDSYLMTYRFERLNGKWYLASFEDASL